MAEVSDGITDAMNGCGPYVPGTGPHGKPKKNGSWIDSGPPVPEPKEESKQVSEEQTHNEDKIRKQSLFLAKRILREEGGQSGENLSLAVRLVYRSLGAEAKKDQEARAAYAFLLTNGVEERKAWSASGMPGVSSVG